MKQTKTGGVTSLSIPLFIQDSSSSTAAGLGSLTFSTSGLTAEYRRAGSSSWTAITLVTKTLGTWTSGGFVVDGSRTGYYELDVPNAAVASGVRWVAIRLYGAANMADCPIEIQIDAFDYQTATQPVNVTQYGGANGTFTSGKPDVNVASYASGQAPLQPTIAGRTLDVTATGGAGIDWSNVENPTSIVSLPNTRVSLTTNQSVLLNDGAITTTTFADNAITDAKVAADVTIASVTGSVGSVVGAVGSVTSGVTVASIAANVITAASMAADAGTEIGAAVLSALGTGTWATAITNKTGNLPSDPADQSIIIAATDAVLARLGAPAGASMSADIATLATAASITTLRGADSDTLKTLSDQIDGISAGTGTGARTVTVTVNDGTTALQNARVRVVEGVNTYTGITNASGVVVFNLDDATYTVSITKSGYTYSGTSLIVDGTETRTYSMTVVNVTPPDDPALCAVSIHVFDQYGADMSGQPVEITFVKWDTTATDTPPVLSVPPVQTTDADGLVSVNLFREAVYKIVYGNAPYTRRVDVTIPDAGTYTVEI